MKLTINNRFFQYVLAPILLGSMAVLAFAPLQWYLIAFIAPAILESRLFKQSPVKAGWTCFLFGLGFFGTGVSWVFVSMHEYTEAPLWAALGATAFLVCIVSILLWPLGYLYRRLMPSAQLWQRCLAFPSLWVLLESIRCWVLTGYPCLFLGYTLIDSPFIGYAPLLGVFGLSFIVVLYGMLLLNLFSSQHAFKKIAVITLIALPLIGQLLKQVEWTSPTGQQYTVALTQGNIPQPMKWDSNSARDNLARYIELTHKSLNADIIVWPEASLPFPLPAGQPYVNAFHELAMEFKKTIIMGVVSQFDEIYFTNSIVVAGQGSGQYDKHHLVPLGEYVPYHSVIGDFVEHLQFPTSFTKPGDKIQDPLHIQNWKVGALICYEVWFPELGRLRAKGTDVLLTISNDGWFGRSLGPIHSFQMARMRAAEMGRPMIRSTNNGITGFINHDGSIQSTAELDTVTILTGTVEGYQGETPLALYGHHVILILLLTLFLIVIVVAYPRINTKRLVR